MRRLLPLRTRATPSGTRTHPHFPGPTETRLSLQPNSVKADLYEYVQGPGILARLPHSIRSITGGGYATARGALPGLSKFSSQASREPGTEPNANSATFGGTDGLAPAGQQYGSAESWGAQVPAGPMGVKLRQRGPCLQPRRQKPKQWQQPGLAVPSEHRAAPKPPVWMHTRS